LTSFIFLFYAFSEIIFCSWLLNLGRKIVFEILGIRAALGLLVGVGTVVAMYHEEYTLRLFGGLFVLIGINTILYVPIMKINRSDELAKEF
jgi:hypothetical protein